VTVPRSPHTFLFADLAGYSALTERHGDERAADIVQEFCDRVRQLLSEHGAEQIKTIGDEVMARVDDPEQAVRLGLRIVGELAQHAAPPVRVGMHTGEAVERGGDWYGGAVNLAARIASAAKAGEVLLSDATRDALPLDPDIILEPRGRRWLKNIPGETSIFAARDIERAGVGLAVDPVCRMAIDPERSAATATHRGRRYEFCSSGCGQAFELDPRRYVASSPRARLARRAFLTHVRWFAFVQAVLFVAWLVAYSADRAEFPWFAFVLVGWGIPLLLHCRAVRQVL
jgi:adenylate cyclase